MPAATISATLDYGGRKGNPWVDVTGRFTGPVVDELAIIFAEDWAFETSQTLDTPVQNAPTPPAKPIAMQVVPTGPGEDRRNLSPRPPGRRSHRPQSGPA
jgi:phosphatidylserine/phosphatidylglycerophosphate/cardiolipin synthase-like enzyme